VSWDDTTEVKGPPPDIARSEPSPEQAFLVVLVGSALGETHKLGGARTVIGRAPTADLRLLDDGISRQHCEIVREGERLLLRDLGSTNGTFCRGVRIKEHVLSDGDKILVGTGTVLKFTYHDEIDEDFHRQLLESVLRDDLTKAYNRKYFLDRAESEFAYALRHSLPTTLITFGVDRLAHINETRGRAAGDAVLKGIAHAIQKTVRVEDVFARTGGDTFSVLCRGADLLQGKIVAERVRQAAERQVITHAGQELSVTISGGVVAVPSPTIKDAAGFVAAAAQMLAEAKNAGRNRMTLWNR